MADRGRTILFPTHSALDPGAEEMPPPLLLPSEDFGSFSSLWLNEGFSVVPNCRLRLTSKTQQRFSHRFSDPPDGSPSDWRISLSPSTSCDPSHEKISSIFLHTLTPALFSSVTTDRKRPPLRPLPSASSTLARHPLLLTFLRTLTELFTSLLPRLPPLATENGEHHPPTKPTPHQNTRRRRTNRKPPHPFCNPLVGRARLPPMLPITDRFSPNWSRTVWQKRQPARFSSHGSTFHDPDGNLLFRRLA